MKYKVRCSKIADLLSGCGKVKNKFVWKNLDVWNETHIELAITIYNEQENIFIPANVSTLDMQAGKELEESAVQLYDSFFKTNYYPEYKQRRSVASDFEKENDWIKGTKDFGDFTKTIDCKISTNKNVFDLKRFVPVENDYVIQLNGYGWLYNTPNLELYNVLMTPTNGQLFKMVSSKAYVENLDDNEQYSYEERLNQYYNYDFMPVKKRIIIKDVPIIENFQEIVKKRVELLNEKIEEYKKKI